MKSFAGIIGSRNSIIVSRKLSALHTPTRTFSAQISSTKHALVIANGDNVSMTYDTAREKKHTTAILKEKGYKATVSDSVIMPVLANRLYLDNNRSNSEIIKSCIEEEAHSQHPTPNDAGNVFIRSVKNGQKTLVPATLRQIIKARVITVGGKDSSQKTKDCSAIASLLEKHFDASTPEQLWENISGHPPLAYLSLSTTPTLDRYASEAHISYQQNIPYMHQESEHFARTILEPRFIDRDRNLIDPEDIKSLCGYSFSAGGKQWMTYIHALERILCRNGMEKGEAQQLIGQKIRLAGIALMPDIRGLSLMGNVSTLNTVSLYDIGTRPQHEESKYLLGNPTVLEMIEENGGVLHVHLEPTGNEKVRHRFLVLGKLGADNLHGHSPKAYVEQIKRHPLAAELYKAYLQGNQQKIADLEASFDKKSVAFHSIPFDRTLEERGITGLKLWEEWKIGNFAEQLTAEKIFKQKSAAISR